MYLFVGFDPDISSDEIEEKSRLITQVLELQNTLDGKYCIRQFCFSVKLILGNSQTALLIFSF